MTEARELIRQAYDMLTYATSCSCREGSIIRCARCVWMANTRALLASPAPESTYDIFDAARKAVAPLVAQEREAERIPNGLMEMQLDGGMNQDETFRWLVERSKRLDACEAELARLHAAPESKRMTRSAYVTLIEEDLDWLLAMPRTLERDHIETIVRNSTERHYGPAPESSAVK